MIEERALVLDAEQGVDAVHSLKIKQDTSEFSGQLVRVKVQRSNACESCSLKSGCGQSALTKLSSSQCLELEVENTLNAQVGDEVVIAIPESGLMSASLRVYFMPLILMVLGAILGDIIHPVNELWTIILSISGLISGFAWARFSSQKQAFDDDFLPKIIKVIDPATVITWQK